MPFLRLNTPFVFIIPKYLAIVKENLSADYTDYADLKKEKNLCNLCNLRIDFRKRIMAQECLHIHKVLDIRGKICPYTMIETRDTLKSMAEDEVLEVITDYEAAAKETIPNFCEKKGYPVETIDDHDGLYRLLIKRL